MKPAVRIAGRLLVLAAPLRAYATLPTVPTVPASAPPAGGSLALVQAMAGLLVVVGLIFACAWLARRFGLQRLGGSAIVKVIASTPLGQRERVVVVEVPGGTWLVLGVTPAQVSTLHSLPAQALPASAAGPQPRDLARQFSARLQEALGGARR